MYKKSYLLSLFLYALAFVSDFFDGYLARKLKAETSLGILLDPIADKVAIFSFVAVLLLGDFEYKPSLFLVTVLLLKEFLVIFGSPFLLKRGFLPKPNFWGKFSVALLFLYGFLLFVGNAFGLDIGLFKLFLEGLIVVSLSVATFLYLKSGANKII